MYAYVSFERCRMQLYKVFQTFVHNLVNVIPIVSIKFWKLMDEVVVTLFQAEMKFKDKWLVCISLGEQTFRTHVSDQLSTCACRQLLGIEFVS